MLRRLAAGASSAISFRNPLTTLASISPTGRWNPLPTLSSFSSTTAGDLGDGRLLLPVLPTVNILRPRCGDGGVLLPDVPSAKILIPEGGGGGGGGGVLLPGVPSGNILLPSGGGDGVSMTPGIMRPHASWHRTASLELIAEEHRFKKRVAKMKGNFRVPMGWYSHTTLVALPFEEDIFMSMDSKATRGTLANYWVRKELVIGEELVILHSGDAKLALHTGMRFRILWNDSDRSSVAKVLDKLLSEIRDNLLKDPMILGLEMSYRGGRIELMIADKYWSTRVHKCPVHTVSIKNGYGGYRPSYRNQISYIGSGADYIAKWLEERDTKNIKLPSVKTVTDAQDMVTLIGLVGTRGDPKSGGYLREFDTQNLSELVSGKIKVQKYWQERNVFEQSSPEMDFVKTDASL